MNWSVFFYTAAAVLNVAPIPGPLPRWLDFAWAAVCATSAVYSWGR